MMTDRHTHRHTDRQTDKLSDGVKNIIPFFKGIIKTLKIRLSVNEGHQESKIHLKFSKIIQLFALNIFHSMHPNVF